MHAFDRQTDGQTEFSSLDRVCIPCSAVKMSNISSFYQYKRKTNSKSEVTHCMRTAAANLHIVPGRPEAPKVTSRKKNEATLTFKPPADNGCSPITSYVIEMKTRLETTWKIVGRHYDSTTLEFTKTNLQPSSEYEFRVIAVNEKGPGQPSEPSAPSKFSKFSQATNVMP